MPNYCDFSCKITGPKKGVDRFINAAQTDYHVGEPNEPEHFWRVFEFNIDSYKEISNGLYEVIAFGYCAWSVHTCFQEGGYQAYWNKDKTPHNGVTIEQLCKEEDLVVEFYSSELGMGFSEHIIIVKDYVYTNDTVDYTECYDELDLDELNERSGKDWTQEQWDEYFKKEDNMVCCEHDWKFANHIELLKGDTYGN